MEAIWFDIGGTIHTQKADEANDLVFADMVSSLLEENGVRLRGEPKKIVEEIDRGAKAYKKYVESKLIELPGDRIWTEFFLESYSEDKEKIAAISEELSYLFDRRRKVITRRDGLVETLEALKSEGYRLGVISNIMSRTFVPRVLKEYGISDYFESLVLSSVCGIRKPDPKIYDIALAEMGVSKEECCYVGDTISRDVIGTRKAGWKMMIQIDNPLTYRKDKEFLSQGWKPDYLIHELKEIPEILKK